MTIEATMSDGSTGAARGVTWTAANPSIASVSSAGVITARGEGPTSVTATVGQATASVAVTVMRPTPARVAISPRAGSVKAGETTTLTARVQDRTGAPLSDPVSWRSSNSGFATVDNAGRVRGVRGGDVYIMAVAGGATDSVRVTVESAPVVGVNPTPQPPDQPARRTEDPPVDKGAGSTGTGAPTAAELNAAFTSAARAIADAIARGQVSQLTATSQFAKIVREDRPKLSGPTRVVQSRPVAADRAEGEVELPLRWTNFAGRQMTGTVRLKITIERSGGAWRHTAAQNLNNP